MVANIIAGFCIVAALAAGIISISQEFGFGKKKSGEEDKDSKTD